MNARTTLRAWQTCREEPLEANAASDETSSTSDATTEYSANALDNGTPEYKSRRESDAALLTLDTIARGSLSVHSFQRYLAYKQALLMSDQDLQSVSLALIEFIQGLYHERADTTLH